MFDGASLIRSDYVTEIKDADEGILFINVVDRKSGEETGSAVCADEFNWWKANAFCNHLGYRKGGWKKRIVSNILPK